MFKLQNTVVHSVCHIPPYTALLKPKSTSPRHNFCSCIIRTLMLLWVRHAPGFPPESTHGVGQPFAAETAQDPSLKTQRDSRLVDTSVGHTWTIRIALAKASRNRVLESKSLQCLPKKKIWTRLQRQNHHVDSAWSAGPVAPHQVPWSEAPNINDPKTAATALS